jgi:hypothetical protein
LKTFKPSKDFWRATLLGAAILVVLIGVSLIIRPSAEPSRRVEALVLSQSNTGAKVKFDGKEQFVTSLAGVAPGRTIDLYVAEDGRVFGLRPPESSNEAERLWSAMFVMSIAIGVFFVLNPWIAYRRQVTAAKNSTWVTGRIEAVDQVDHGGQRISYTYSIEDDQYDAEAIVSKGTVLAPGLSVWVLTDKDDPTSCALFQQLTYLAKDDAG